MTGIFGATFNRGWDRGAMNDHSWVGAYVEVESALVSAGEQAGVIPAAAAHAIRQGWTSAEFDVADIGRAAGAGGSPIIPLVIALKDALPAELREYVHLGATSQDIQDTATMLLARRAITVISGHLSAAADCAAALAADHGATEMAGRTLMQDALPVTFGLKAASWMAGLDGATKRLAQVGSALPVQYGGPVGTFSGSRGRGPAIRAALAELLELAEPTLAWHTMRLPVADLAGALGTVAGIVGKVALDVVLLSQTAVAELGERQPLGERRGGSSSMQHKHNPIGAISARACAMRAPGLVSTLFAAMAQEHERAAGAWHSEWETLADLVRLTGSAAAWLADSLRDIVVDPAAMRRWSQPMQTDAAAAQELVRVALDRRRGVPLDHPNKESTQ